MLSGLSNFFKQRKNIFYSFKTIVAVFVASKVLLFTSLPDFKFILFHLFIYLFFMWVEIYLNCLDVTKKVYVNYSLFSLFFYLIDNDISTEMLVQRLKVFIL